MDNIIEESVLKDVGQQIAELISASSSDSKQPWYLVPLELPRTITEITLFSLLTDNLSKSLPQGDGHTVMILPGFLSHDMLSAPMIQYLRALGYDATGWEIGHNRGHNPERELALYAKIAQLYETNGQKPITLIGHSLGGTFACAMAKKCGSYIRQIITLGSPLHGDMRRCHPAHIYEIVANVEISDAQQELDGILDIPVPLTCIYSKTDGIVPPDMSVIPSTNIGDVKHRQNVEVMGSHCGLIFNPMVAIVLGRMLLHDKSTWKPFKPEGALEEILFSK